MPGEWLARLSGLAWTLALAFAGGWVCARLGVPAPWLLGSLVGTWAGGLAMRRVRPRLGIPRQVHVPVVLGLGVMIGAMFTPETLAAAGRFMGSISVLLGATVVATAAGFVYLTRVRGYEPRMAMLCSLPGGQAELVLLSRELMDNSYVVALCHLVRVSTVFLATPMILALLGGEAGVAHSHEVMDHLPGLFSLPWTDLAAFVGLAVLGYLAGRVARLPMPHLLGPLLLSVLAHLSGVVAVPRIGEFVLFAQVMVGGAVGGHLAQAPVSRIPEFLRDGLVNAIIIISVYTGCAYAFSRFSDEPFVNLFLSFIPGGLYEVTLLTLLFGFDVAFVAVHHTVRVLLVFSTIPLLVRWFAPGQKRR